MNSVQFSSFQSLSHVWLFVTSWIAARQASLSITISGSSLRLTSIESVMPSSHLILGRPLLFLPPIFPSIRIFSNESVLRIRWPKYWSFSFSISPSNDIQDWLPLGFTGWTIMIIIKNRHYQVLMQKWVRSILKDSGSDFVCREKVFCHSSIVSSTASV